MGMRAYAGDSTASPAGYPALDRELKQLLPNGKPVAEGSHGLPDPVENTPEATEKTRAHLASLPDGTYEGTGQGVDGAVRVTIRITDGVLDVLFIWQDGETQGVGGYEAIKNGTYAAMINKAQGPDTDNIAGATLTTYAIRTAVEDALAQAEGASHA